VTHAWFNSNLVSQWFIVPGIIGLLTLVVSLLVTALSHQLIDRFAGSETFELVGHITHDAGIAPAIDHKHALLVVHISPRFSDDLASGKSAVLQVIVDGRNSNTALLALNYVRSVLLDFSAD